MLSLSVKSDEEALQQDVKLLEFIGHFKEYAAATAQTIIDHYHIHGQLDQKFEKPCRFPFGVSSLPQMIKDGIVYRFACDYHGKLVFF